MNSRVLSIPLVAQYHRPFCLYACTSMVLKYFGIDKSMEEVANEVFLPSPVDVRIGETSCQIRDYLRDNGLNATIYSGENWSDIKRHIENGHALIAGVRIEPTDWDINHAWVLRGFSENGIKTVIYNKPEEDPGSSDPVTYDPDGDGLPGDSMEYETFESDHWSSPLPFETKNYIAVSYPGQDFGADYNWRATGKRNIFRFVYHSTNATKKFFTGEHVEAIFEGIIAIIAFFICFQLGALQILGQYLEVAGQWLIDKGNEYLDKDGVGWKILGGILVGAGGIVTAIGYSIDFVSGVGGIGGEVVVDFLDDISSIFTGANGGSTSKKLGDRHITLCLLVEADPWRSRWGRNWEKVHGSWSVTVKELSQIDEITVNWNVNIGGWGIDNWSLSRRVLELAGTLVYDQTDNPTNYNKRFKTKLTNVQGIRMSFGKNKCKYGGWGGMTRVKLEVEVKAKHGGDSVTVKDSYAIYGLST